MRWNPGNNKPYNKSQERFLPLNFSQASIIQMVYKKKYVQTIRLVIFEDPFASWFHFPWNESIEHEIHGKLLILYGALHAA